PLTVYDPTSLQSWFQAGVPTPLGPLLDVAFNTDYKGSPIAPLGAQFGAGDPRTSEQFFADTPIYYIKAAALLSAITAPMGRALGGAGSRGIEVSPNQIEYLLGRFLPGVVNDAVRLWETGSDRIEGANVSLNEWPVLSKVVGESGGRRVLPGRFRDIDGVFERIRTDLRYESRADVLGGASTLERWLANNSFWPNARRSLKALQERRNALLRAGNRVEARKIEEKMNAVRLRAVNQALRIQNLESGPGYDTETMRYFRGGSE
ncbi:MAG: LPD38 domain-containing protein, partial [Phycisphaerales bacterium]